MENYQNNGTDNAQNFREILLNCKKHYGDRDIFRVKEGEGIRGVGYEEFYNRIYGLGNALAHGGFLDGQKIAVMGETSVDWVATYFAVVCGGGVIVPVDKELPKNEIANILNDSEAVCFVYSSTFHDVVEKILPDIPNVRCLIEMGDAEETATRGSLNKTVVRGMAMDDRYSAIQTDREKLCTLLYTSGTTGKSKGVMLCQRNIIAASEGGLALLDIGRVCMSVLPIHHSLEFTHGIIMMLQGGTTICINDSLRYFMQNLQLFKPESIFLVPLFIGMIYRKIWETAKAAGRDEELCARIKESNALLMQGIDKRAEMFDDIRQALGGNLSVMLCGGSPLPASMMREFREMGIMLINGYGITECSPLVTVTRNRFYKDGAVGVAIACNQIKITDWDEDGNGEIWVKGDNVMMGYYKNDAATSEVMEDGWFDTGDIGNMDEQGFLTITGRKKNLIILSNGKNVYPEEIEGYYMKIPYIQEMVVFAPQAESLTVAGLQAEIYINETYEEQHGKEETSKLLARDIAEISKTLPGYKQIQKYAVREQEFEKTTKKSIKRFMVAQQ